MRKTSLFMGMVVVAFFCINFGGTTQYSESLGGFELKKGAPSYQGQLVEGGKELGAITKICFKDNEYKDLARSEGDTYLRVFAENSDVPEKIDLKMIKKIEIGLENGSKFCARPGGKSCFWLRVTYIDKAGAIHEKPYQADLSLAVNFDYVDGRKCDGILLHKIEKITDIGSEAAFDYPAAAPAPPAQ